MPTQEKIQEYKQQQVYRNPFPTTDIIIEYNDGKKEGIILIERKNPPYGLAIPGGFAEWGISLEDNAIKEAMEETNLEIILENPEHPLCVKSNPVRDPRGHMVSITYIARGYGRFEAGDDAKKTKRSRLYSIDEVKQIVKDHGMVFDHSDILKEYLKYRGHEL